MAPKLVVLHPSGFQFTVVLLQLPRETSLCNGSTCVTPVISSYDGAVVRMQDRNLKVASSSPVTAVSSLGQYWFAQP